MSIESPEIRPDVIQALLRNPRDWKTISRATAAELRASSDIHSKVGEAAAKQAELLEQLGTLQEENGNRSVEELPPKEQARPYGSSSASTSSRACFPSIRN